MYTSSMPIVHMTHTRRSICTTWWGNNIKQARGAPQTLRSNEQRLHLSTTWLHTFKEHSRTVIRCAWIPKQTMVIVSAATSLRSSKSHTKKIHTSYMIVNNTLACAIDQWDWHDEWQHYYLSFSESIPSLLPTLQRPTQEIYCMSRCHIAQLCTNWYVLTIPMMCTNAMSTFVLCPSNMATSLIINHSVWIPSFIRVAWIQS